MKISHDIKLFLKSVPNAYGQVFFSDHRIFAAILLVVTFFDLYAGLLGLLSVLITGISGYLIGFDRKVISRGIFGFNSLLVGLGLGIYYEPGWQLILIIIMSAVLTLLIAVTLQGVIGKYTLPFLSIPFLLTIWIMTLATREFTALGISERGIYTFNALYTLGGEPLVALYEWWNNLEVARSLRIYFISLGAILFQFNVLSGILIAAGLLLYSRISFTLSLLGFFTAFLFYELIGADISELSYSYIGFNYILTAIAIGGFFIIPSWRSYLWVIILIPMVATATISLANLFTLVKLPIYSLPFNLVVLLFLYALKFRVKVHPGLSEVMIQHNTPEKNLYAFHNDYIRFRHEGDTSLRLPFLGTWTVSQAHDGEYTHKEEYRHAWDFVIMDAEGSQFRGRGDLLQDYYCHDKMVLAPADGTVELVVDRIPDNGIGEVNLKENWGNTIILKHEDTLFTSLSHLKEGSIKVREGDSVRAGQEIGRCGNSGRSPFPHLHFQVQRTPYIGSPTLEYPIRHYILNLQKGYRMCSFALPEKGDLVSNIERSDLLHQAFHFIPGKTYRFDVVMNGEKRISTWEVNTDPYNNTFITCHQTGAIAYFQNDGDLLYFTHYSGEKNCLLYYFFQAAFQVSFGFYQDLEISDRYPLNLVYRQPLLGLQDLLAPFWKFLRSEFHLRYKELDNVLAPEKIILASTAKNRLGRLTLKEMECEIELGLNGIQALCVKAKKLEINAICQED